MFKISRDGTVEVASREDAKHVVDRLATRVKLRKAKGWAAKAGQKAKQKTSK